MNAEDASCSLITGIPTKEWDDITYPGLTFSQTSSQEVFNMEPITDEAKWMFSHNKHNYNIIYVGDTILDSEVEAGID